MNDVTLSNSKIVAAYRERTRGSAERAKAAREVLPGGLVHDARHLEPHPIYVNRAAGSHKWDIDGNEYVDYFGGHGALILGHCHPDAMAAVHTQLDLGTHYGACHELEVRWAERVRGLVPCAERVRFTSSGTEANLMALRLARAHTGRSKLVRFRGHFHGWQDHVAFGVDGHFDGSPAPGIIDGIADQVLLADAGDLEGTEALLESSEDIAAVILEPTGGSFGVLPVRKAFVEMLRRVTAARGIVLIFDEVVTGFRVSPGGAQAHYGITPDLASFAKILAGGLPGGAVTGREVIMSRLDFAAAAKKGFEKVAHQGTYNANPVSAAAGIATLDIIADGNVCQRANETAGRVRDAMNAVFAEEDVPWAVYGEHSGFYVYTNPAGEPIDPQNFDPHALDFKRLRGGGGHPASHRFRLGLMVSGVDISGKPGGLTSAVHTEDDVERTAEATRATVRMLKAEGEFA